MTPIAIAQLIHRAPAFLHRFGQRFSDFIDGIEEARVMARRFKDLSQMTDAQLAERGIKRQDIPQAVLNHNA